MYIEFGHYVLQLIGKEIVRYRGIYSSSSGKGWVMWPW